MTLVIIWRHCANNSQLDAPSITAIIVVGLYHYPMRPHITAIIVVVLYHYPMWPYLYLSRLRQLSELPAVAADGDLFFVMASDGLFSEVSDRETIEVIQVRRGFRFKAGSTRSSQSQKSGGNTR